MLNIFIEWLEQWKWNRTVPDAKWSKFRGLVTLQPRLDTTPEPFRRLPTQTELKKLVR